MPQLLYPQERPSTHCTGDWVGPRVCLDRCGKLCHPPGFNPQTAQPVVSHYTNYAILALHFTVVLMKSITINNKA
jgi:hypothetical protein